jgi:hypothetical protein
MGCVVAAVKRKAAFSWQLAAVVAIVTIFFKGSLLPILKRSVVVACCADTVFHLRVEVARRMRSWRGYHLLVPRQRGFASSRCTVCVLVAALAMAAIRCGGEAAKPAPCSGSTDGAHVSVVKDPDVASSDVQALTIAFGTQSAAAERVNADCDSGPCQTLLINLSATSDECREEVGDTTSPFRGIVHNWLGLETGPALDVGEYTVRPASLQPLGSREASAHVCTSVTPSDALGEGTCATAVSGRIQLDQVDLGGRVQGSYDVVFSHNEHATGTFDAVFCTRSCVESGTSH